MVNEKERPWIARVKATRETIALVRDTAILFVLIVLLVYPAAVTGFLTRVGLALESAGFHRAQCRWSQAGSESTSG